MQALVPRLPDGAHATGRELPAQPVPPADAGIGLSHGHILTSSTAGIGRGTTLPSREVPTAPQGVSLAHACRTTRPISVYAPIPIAPQPRVCEVRAHGTRRTHPSLGTFLCTVEEFLGLLGNRGGLHKHHLAVRINPT